LDLTVAALGAPVVFGSGFLSMVVLLGAVFWLLGRLCEWLRYGIGTWGRIGCIDNSPRQTTWLHTSPRSTCSAEEPARLAFELQGCLYRFSFDSARTPAVQEAPLTLSI
jgi:hypothetical protein